MITTEEVARLRVPLAKLPGFDPVGLKLWDETGPGHLCDLHTGVHTHVTSRPDALGHPEDFDVDLADASTRDRVARWAAARSDLDIGSTAPDWYYADGFWRLRWDCESVNFCPENVDPEDTRRLPDGSKYADALALALVATHLGSTP